MAMQRETMTTGGKIDNLVYDLVAMIHEKSQGLAAYDKYLKDAQNNQQCRDLIQRIRDSDSQDVQELTSALGQVLQGR